MALVNDAAFLIYQLRVSFLRANDPTGERVLTFSDLAVPLTGSGGGTRGRQGSAPSPMSPAAARRNTSASELRQQVAQNTTANPYIMACGYYPETEAVGSPEVDHSSGYMYSRPAPRMVHPGTGTRGKDGSGGGGAVAPPPSARYPDGGEGAAGRAKRTNRSAKVAPTGEGREEVVGLGVVPQHPEMLLDEYATPARSGSPPQASRRSLDVVRPRPLAVVDEVADPGSLSDGAQTPVMSEPAWAPRNMPPRRSLDTTSLSAPLAQARGGERRGRHQGHAASSSVATIRLQQRPSNGSSRDAMALGIDFDVKSMFDAADHAATSPEFKAQQRLPPSSKTSSSETSRDGSIDHDRVPGAMPSGGAPRPKKRQGSETASQSSVRGAGSIALRANRSDTSARMLLSAHQRTDDDAASSTAPALKRSVTLPTKRPGAYNYHAGQKSKWVGGAYADAVRQQGSNQASGWVGGAEQTTSWDQSSDDDDDTTPLSRRGASTHTWYGPRAGIRPISMFPPPHAAYPIPPMPLMFGADDSDDDIDLDGDDGSSRTPALIGLGFGRGLSRPRAASPTPSLRSRKNSVAMLGADTRRLFPKPALATSVPVSSPLSATPVASAVSGAKYEHLALEAGAARPRGISDPERRQSARATRADPPPPLLPALTPNIRLSNNNNNSSSGSSTVEPPQGPDDGTPLVSARALDWSFKSACATAAVAAASIGSKGQAGGQPDLPAKSEFVPPSTPAKSGLSALLSSKIEIRQNPFSEEFSAIGNPTNGSSLLALKVFVIGGDGPQSQLLNVKVRQSATVEQVIGFALHRYIDDGLTPPLEHDLQDVVMWALRIADDGEVDDDFPALDRTRPVASFGYDEFALCLSTPDQVKLNEDIRVRQGRPSRMVRPKSILLPMASAATAATTKSIPSSAADASSGDPAASRQFYCNIAHRVEVSTVVLQPSRAATSSTASIFVGTAAPTRLASQGPAPFGNPSRRPSSPGSSTSAMCESRLFKIRVLDEPQSAEALRTTTVETDTSATIDMVLALVCRKKQFSEDRYALGVLEDDLFIALDTDMRVSQIPLGVELCLQKIGGATSLAPEAYDRAPRWSNDGAMASGALLVGTKTSTVDATGADSSSVYHTFRVIRRAQMFARHERSLVIDGDVVTLMPSDHRIETAKTLTFHISNIVCKRNQKSPKKIRLFISRRGSTGEKSVDLEAMSEEDALQICNILLRLHDQYVSNGT